MHVTAVMTGLEELDSRMADLNDGFSQEALTEIALAAADIVLAEVRPNAPVAVAGSHVPKGHKPGTLKDKGIGKMILRRYSGANSVAVGVGFTKRGWYGIFSELGSTHQSARPFVVPGFDRKKGEIVAMIGMVVTTGIASWKEGGRAGFLKPRVL